MIKLSRDFRIYLTKSCSEVFHHPYFDERINMTRTYNYLFVGFDEDEQAGDDGQY